MQRKSLLLQISQLNKLRCLFYQSSFFSSEKTQTFPLFPDKNDDPLYSDVPKPRTDKSERKPYPTPMKELIKRAKQEKELRNAQPCRLLEHPPDNGLLVPELVDVAHRVYRAREFLLSGLSKLVQVIAVQRCRFCYEVHIGNMGHEIRTCFGLKSGLRSATHVWRKGGVVDVVFFPKCFHLYDRVGKPRVVHDERHSVPQIPAILELCIQAGLDIEKYPSKRRTMPVYSIEGRIVDFESVSGMNDMESYLFLKNLDGSKVGGLTSDSNLELNDEENNLTELSTRTLDSWFEMIGGVKKIMEKYSVWTCGYCPEVQVGPKGHKVRMCKASKHQSRNGLHAWQEATTDDLVGPNYVWHVLDLNGPPLRNDLKRYYGKAPAVVELCVQAGAPVPDQYRSMMRLDVVPPDRDEVDLVA
ncbi:APO protein 3, mitochondrial isoform X2 [Durio zibethinus]|nr:APO protein 3, mitochondrial isoform X2 [Durio zibethinus]XP_022735917.1 APO protein 3, mitochondrial isoform X2 [Durio zibethinus]